MPPRRASYASSGDETASPPASVHRRNVGELITRDQATRGFPGSTRPTGRAPSPDKNQRGARASSPDKRVSFGRRLVRGPSPAYSRQRTPSQPPTRVNPRVELVDESVGSSSDAGTLDPDPPSQQLRSEVKAATVQRQQKVQPPQELYYNVHDDLSHEAAEERPSQSRTSATGVQQQQQRSMPVTEAYKQQNKRQSPQQALFEIIGEEQESHRDDEVCRRLHNLRAQIMDFAGEYVTYIRGYHGPRIQRASVDLLCRDASNAHLLRYIGWLAQGGANGVDSWNQLLSDKDCLNALVVGIVGTALKEHVFSPLWFGGTTAQIEELEKLQQKGQDDDGYSRTKSRAKACARFKDTTNYIPAARKLAVGLRKLLTPLLHMSDGPNPSSQMSQELANELFGLVTIAGILSREMRMCGDVIYHWPPTFKDEEFDPERMECLNITSMIQNSPYELKKSPTGHERSVLAHPTPHSEAIVRIVAFPGLVAHRQSGGALAKQLLSAEKIRKTQEAVANARLPSDVQLLRSLSDGDRHALTGEEGFRTRVVCKSVVHLEWGTQRLLTREAGTSRHLDAMRDGDVQRYEDDRKGFVELFDYFLRANPGFELG